MAPLSRSSVMCPFRPLGNGRAGKAARPTLSQPARQLAFRPSNNATEATRHRPVGRLSVTRRKFDIWHRRCTVVLGKRHLAYERREKERAGVRHPVSEMRTRTRSGWTYTRRRQAGQREIVDSRQRGGELVPRALQRIWTTTIDREKRRSDGGRERWREPDKEERESRMRVA